MAPFGMFRAVLWWLEGLDWSGLALRFRCKLCVVRIMLDVLEVDVSLLRVAPPT